MDSMSSDYSFTSDGGSIYIVSLYTGISVGLASMADYNLMKSIRDGEPATTSAQRATIKNYLSQINPVTITALNAAVLNLAQDNASQTATLEAYISSH